MRVHYSGSPRPIDKFEGFHWARTAAGKPWVATSCQTLGAHSWWPCKASFFHPEDKPQRLDVDLTVPAGLYAVSNGRLRERRIGDDGTETFRWTHPYPLETYAVTLNVAPYVVEELPLKLPGLDESVPFTTYVLPEDVEKARLQFAEVPELLRVFSEHFGPWPFPESKIGIVQTPFWGMEHSTAIAYGSSFPAWLKRESQRDPYASRNRWFDYILVHELAHEFFGQMSRAVPRRGKLQRERGSDAKQAYAAILYAKGGLVLNTLRHCLDDDETWWRVLRTFQERHRHGNASGDDFRDVLEELSGRSWGRFLHEWIEGEGFPRVSGRVLADSDGVLLEVKNEPSSVQGIGGFHVPLDLTWNDARGEQRERVWLAPGATSKKIPTAGKPLDLRVVDLRRVLGRHDVRVE